MDDKIVSSKIEIINHFDNLIQRVDIDIEECLEKYNEDQVLSDLKCYKSYKKKEMNTRSFEISDSPIEKSYEIKHIEDKWLESVKRIEDRCEKSEGKDNEINAEINENPDDIEYDKIYKTVDLWSEETKVVDYLNQVRMRTIEELRKAQEETLEIYKSQSDDSNFYFQVLYTQSKSEEWIFKLFTFITDFYMSPDDIKLLEDLINAEIKDNFVYLRSKIVFDEKMILIALLQNCFFENLEFEKFPSHVISFPKKALLNSKQISLQYVNGVNLTNSSSIDLTNLESFDIYILDALGRVNLNGFPFIESLFLTLCSIELLSLKNLPSLRYLEIDYICGKIQSEIFDYLPSIEYLTLRGEFSHFNLDSLVNLKSLSLIGSLKKDFNLDLFKNISNQLTHLSFDVDAIDDKCVDKLFCGHQFPNMKTFTIFMSFITKLEKKLFDRFPMLESLNMHNNKGLRLIDSDAFYNLKHLISLDLCHNCINSLKGNHFSGLDKLKYLRLSGNKLESFEENVFSSLKNLRILDLSHNNITKLNADSFEGLSNLQCLDLKKNNLTDFDLKILDNIGQIKLIDLSENAIANKDEILNRIKESKIKFDF